MTISFESFKPIENELVPQKDSDNLNLSQVSRKNEELQKHLKAVEYMDEIDQFLMFALNRDDYSLDILSVKEIIDIPPITRVPRTPGYMLGVINLRGSVVPVVDLKQRFGFKKSDFTENSCIIIVEVEGNNAQPRVFGLLVDAVEEVINLRDDAINEATKVGVHIKTDYLKGVGNYNGGFVMVLDLQTVLPLDEIF